MRLLMWLSISITLLRMSTSGRVRDGSRLGRTRLMAGSSLVSGVEAKRKRMVSRLASSD